MCPCHFVKHLSIILPTDLLDIELSGASWKENFFLLSLQYERLLYPHWFVQTKMWSRFHFVRCKPFLLLLLLPILFTRLYLNKHIFMIVPRVKHTIWMIVKGSGCTMCDVRSTKPSGVNNLWGNAKSKKGLESFRQCMAWVFKVKCCFHWWGQERRWALSTLDRQQMVEKQALNRTRNLGVKTEM